MPNPKSTNAEHAELMSAWLDNKLTDQQRQQFEVLCAENSEFAEQVKLVNQISFHAQDYQQQVPRDWNKQATFDSQFQRKWWQWQGLPAFSTALSMLAIVLVISGFEVRLEQGAMTFSFNRPSQNVDQQVDQKLVEFKRQQQQVMTAYAKSLQEQQLATSTQLTNYLLSSSRQERKEDFAELIKFINQQRDEDQVFFARQLNQLQNKIHD
jgi:hypothetical protein